MVQAYILIVLATVTAVASQFLFKKGMNQIGDINISLSNILELIKSIAKSPHIIIGLFCYGLAFIFWLFVLSKMKLSFVYPFTALNIVLVIVVSYFFLKEPISYIHIISIILICSGIFLLVKS